MKNYKSIITEKGMSAYEHQLTFLTNPDFFEPTKPVVLAVGTGGGKTFTTIMKLDIWYSNPVNRGKKTVIFSHATNVLKDNFKKALEGYGNKSFSYCVIKDSSEIQEVFNSECEVIIILPQTIKNHLSNLPQVDWMIVDEAHEWYGEKSYNDIIDALKPKYQLLLTGTPSKFNKQPDKFYYHHVSVDELRQAGKLGNAKIYNVVSNYLVNNDDILPSGNVKETITDNNNNNLNSLENVCKSMLKTLKKENLNMNDLFDDLKKTIIFCNSQKQAVDFYTILKKELNGKVLKSLSQDGGNSSEFESFANDDTIKLLILCRKGRLGFDMANLYNIVDFTLSTNVNNISQMFGRVLRPDNKNTVKNYFKVVPSNSSSHYLGVMTLVLRLTMPDAYKIFDGNQNQMEIPKMSIPQPSIENNEDNENDNEPTNNKRDGSEFILRDIDPDLIMDLDLFHKIKEIEESHFQIISWTTLDEVRKECYGLPNEKWTKEKVLKVAEECKYKKDFYAKAGAYVAAKRFRMMKQVLKLLQAKKLPPNYWQDPENVKREAKAFKNISAFEKQYSAGAKAARKFELVKEIWPNIGEDKKRPINPDSKRQLKLQIKNQS